MPRRGRKRLLLLSGVLLIASCAHGPELPARKGVLDPKVQRIRGSVARAVSAALGRELTGVSIALVQDDRLLWAEGFGWADRERNLPADIDTVYRVGSLAKPFTAAALMQLAAADRVDIDQPLSLYLPGFRIRSRYDLSATPITVRAVLCHHAGLPSDLNRGMWSGESFTAVAPALQRTYLAFPPERVFGYSNVGYSLLGHAIQSVSGRPFAEHMRVALFEPLGMVDTGYAAGHSAAAGYRHGERRQLLPIRDLPAFGLHTSARDLARFMSALLGGSGPVDAALFRRMTEIQNADRPLDGPVRVGLGWFLEWDSIVPGQRVVRHGGSTLYFGSELILLPELGLGVAVLANDSGSRDRVAELAERVLRLAAAELAPQAPAAVPARAAPAAGEPLPWRPGRFATAVGLVALRPEEGELCGCLDGRTLDMVLLPDGRFGVATDALPSVFAPLQRLALARERAEGRELLVGYRDGRRYVLGSSMPEQPVPVAWRARAGRWRVENADPRFPLEDLQLLYENDTLCLQYRMPLLAPQPVRVPLVAVSDSEAVIGGIGRSRGDTVRFDPDSGRLHWSGYVAAAESSSDGSAGLVPPAAR